ncbi:MAG: hypothetical protein ACRDZO_08000 [Egibacteraceae bacterium]
MVASEDAIQPARGAGRAVRRRPTLAIELLSGALGVELPGFDQARVESGEFTDLGPTEYRADTVVVLSAAGCPVAGVVVEVQLSRDPHKRWSWPVYAVTLRARLRCPVLLLVVCVDAATAAWCAAPIALGYPGDRVTPLVLGPRQAPVVTDAGRAAQMPELAVLSALAHGGDPARRGVLDALVAGLRAVDEERGTLYADLVLDALPQAARRYLEELMATGTYEYQSEFIRRFVGQGRTEGKAEGKAEALLAVLDARGIDVPAEARDRITGCTGLRQLDAWIRRAATAATVEDLFA